MMRMNIEFSKKYINNKLAKKIVKFLIKDKNLKILNIKRLKNISQSLF